MNYSILFLFSLLLSFLQYFFHRQFKRIGTKNKLQVMNLILATHAKPVLAHKAPTICPSFLYQSIHPALCPNHIPSHMWMLYKVNLDWKKEDNAKKKKEEEECWQAIKNHFVPASFLSLVLFTRSKESRFMPRLFIISRPFIYNVHGIIKRPCSTYRERLMVSK